MKQLTKDQRMWRVLAASGAIEGYKGRLFSKRFADGAFWFAAGIISGLFLALIIDQIFRGVLLP